MFIYLKEQRERERAEFSIISGIFCSAIRTFWPMDHGCRSGMDDEASLESERGASFQIDGNLMPGRTAD